MVTPSGHLFDMEGSTTPAKSPAPVPVPCVVRPVRRSLANQGIVRDLTTNMQSVQRPPAAPPPSAASAAQSYSQAVTIIRSTSLFAPAVTDEPAGDLNCLDCLFEEGDVTDVGGAFGLSALAHVADDVEFANSPLNLLAHAIDVHRSAPESDEKFTASISAPISLNIHDHTDAELPEALHGLPLLDSGPAAPGVRDPAVVHSELGAVDNSDVILDGFAGGPSAFDCPCCDCEGFSTRGKLALRAHYSMCVPETEHELACLHKAGLAQCEHCTLWFVGITRHQETCKAGATGYRFRTYLPSVPLPIATDILEWLHDLCNQQLTNPLVLY